MTTLQTPDLINSLFEILGASFQAMNVKAILRDKEIKGVSWMPTAFFWAWGVWNLFFYWHLHQWLSIFGSIALTAVNLTWIILVLRLNKNNERNMTRFGRM